MADLPGSQQSDGIDLTDPEIISQLRGPVPNTNKPKGVEKHYAGDGLDADREYPDNPQLALLGSHHPFAPFPGNALKWESFLYDDGTA